MWKLKNDVYPTPSDLKGGGGGGRGDKLQMKEGLDLRLARV